MTGDFNSAEYWYPLIAAHPELVDLCPRTIFVPYDHAEMLAIREGLRYPDEEAAWYRLVGQVRHEAEVLGLPVFIRTDLTSAKHSGPEAYRVAEGRLDEVDQVLGHTIEDAEMKLWPFAQPTSIMVRQWIDLPAPFRAFGGHPIAREWRYFATPGGVTCRHFYWPADAIRTPDAEHWEAHLAALAEVEPPEHLDTLASLAARACPAAPEWSVDFAADASGHWWLIDMATAEQSWHPTHDDKEHRCATC